MDLVRTLGVAIDPSAAKKGGAEAAAAFHTVSDAAVKTERAIVDLQKRMLSTASDMKRTADVVREGFRPNGLIRVRELLAGVGLASKETTVGLGSIRSALGAASTAAAGFGVALGAAGLAAFTADLVRTQIQIQRVTNALQFASGGEFDFNQRFTRGVADVLGLDRLSSAREFAKFIAAGKDTEFTSKELRDVFVGVAEASTVLGLSADETAGAINALQQMISKGTVQAEELRGQLGERLPGAFNIAARAMGVTTAELGKMLEQGQITAHDLLPALAGELQRTFGPDSKRAAQSLQAEINRLTSAWTDFKDALFQSHVGDFFLGLIKAAGGAAEAVTALLRATGRLPFDSHAIKPKEIPSWGRVGTPDPRLLQEFSYAGTYGRPRGDPWMLGQFSYGIDQFRYGAMSGTYSPMVPWPKALIDEMTLIPKPAGIYRDVKSTIDRSMLGAFRYGAGDATRDLRRSEDWRPEAERWLRVREVGEGTIHALSNGFSGFFDDLVMGTERGTAAFKKMFVSILQDIAKITTRNLIAEPIAIGIGAMFGIGGTNTKTVPKSHTGSLVGSFGGTMSMVNPFVFAGAPRLHSGLAPDEFPAILQRGEAVVPKSQASDWGRSDTYNISVNVDGSRGGTPEQNQSLGREIARHIEAVIDMRIARAAQPRGILRSRLG